MAKENKSKVEEKTQLHPRNKHRSRYDLQKLVKAYPNLKKHVGLNKYGDESINFFNADAVKALNIALLKDSYGISKWDIPKGFLCPPIPGRADYIHHIGDLLNKKNATDGFYNENITCLDIGTGASCIYPIIGIVEYGWNFIASDIDPASLESAEKIIKANPVLKNKIKLKKQKDPNKIFNGIVNKDDYIDVCICNPPFHSSMEEAEKGSRRKLTNLKKKAIAGVNLNFGGKESELWCDGGEQAFVKRMIEQSKFYSRNFLWFTCMVSKESNVKPLTYALKDIGASRTRVIPMGQGNKSSRVFAWTFQSKAQHDRWIQTRRGIVHPEYL